ncbi:MAG TPA: substrate-binding domain-containing protein [Albitalea sp.]|uniref:substrate-binding domain-containing protein n=1 Tax=Piscinibacter sp. TaxID=1903157 RepID=UPI002ED40BF1
MTSRRHTLLRLGAAAASLAWVGAAAAAQRRSLADPLRLAADDALVDSGLAASLQRTFGQDTGVAVQLIKGPASTVLEALERGEHDAALTNAPDVELPLEKQGLIHDRRAIVTSDFVVVGPTALLKPLAAGKDAGLALARLAQAESPFLTRPDGSGSHLAELAAWRLAKTAPGGDWYRKATPGKPLLADARERNACVLVERGVWAAQGAIKGMAALVDSDPRLAVDVHVMRTFRAERQHPAGKLFMNWITDGKGRALAASHRGYRPTGS